MAEKEDQGYVLSILETKASQAANEIRLLQHKIEQIDASGQGENNLAKEYFKERIVYWEGVWSEIKSATIFLTQFKDRWYVNN